ncbi:MAG: 2-hydroxyacid dehydrogenase [Ferruginibacter sp.]
MKTLFYSFKDFENSYFQKADCRYQSIEMTSETLGVESAYLAKGFDAISIFSGDNASAEVLQHLRIFGVRYITIRATGYDNVDIAKAESLGIRVANVPAYSPHAIAEHAVALMLALNRKIILSHRNLLNQDFRIDDLIGFDLHGKTVGIVGTGKIGSALAKILDGFGCSILAYDMHQNENIQSLYGVKYCTLNELAAKSDIISIHLPLTDQTRWLIDEDFLIHMKQGAMLINTARGAIVKTVDVIAALKSGHLKYFGTDVYEKERGVFFFDHKHSVLTDNCLDMLLKMPNVLVTPHQAFATTEALQNIAAGTLHNLECWSKQVRNENELNGSPDQRSTNGGLLPDTRSNLINNFEG